MNIFQLISKLKKIRNDTYLTAIDQALYHELVSICNESKWKDVFYIRSNTICGNLCISDNTLRKSRKSLADCGLLSFESCKDKRIGCYYSFVQKLSNDVVSSAISSSAFADDIADDVADDETPVDIESPEITSAESSSAFADDKNGSPATSSANAEDETKIPPIIDMKTKNKRESLALTHEPPPPQKPKTSRKKEGDEKPLVYPFTSIAFMATWEELRNTPKWKKKLNYALQLSLNKLGQFEEAFAIEQMERAIESNWTGVVFSETGRIYQEWLNRKHGKSISATKSTNSSSTANERKESVEGLADLAEGVLQGIGAEKFK